jgi:hypothetical protein
MEWLKAKYDRLLLGTFGTVALLAGGLLVSKVLGFNSQFAPEDEVRQNANFGEDKSAERVDAALTRLSEPAEFKPPVVKGKPVSLFVSAPVLKTVDGAVIAILSPDAKQVRPPIDNEWLYRYSLDITRQDIADIDTDNDGFSNAEEFTGKSNPKDPQSLPAAHTKLVFKEVLKDELSLKFNAYNDDNDLQIQRTAPVAKKYTAFTKVGEGFAIEKGGEPAYKIEKVEKREVKDGGVTDIKPVVILSDLKNPKAKPLEIVLGKVLELPTLRAKIANTLGKEELIEGAEGAEISFPSAADVKYTVLKVTDQKVDLEYTEQGKTEKTQFSLELK